MTSRQREILDFIDGYWCLHRRPPTVREIGAAIGLKSPASVHYHLEALARNGLVEHVPNSPRSIRIREAA